MNVRSILFFICVFGSYFLLSEYFFDKPTKSNKEYVQEQKKLDIENRQKWEKKQVDATVLPILQLTDSEIDERAIDAISYQDHYFTFSTKHLPKTLYKGAQKLQLAFEANFEKEPALYVPEGTSPSFSLPGIPPGMDLELQVVCVERNAPPKIYVARYEDGLLDFPLQRPKRSGLALWNNNGTYTPIGVYDNTNGQFRLLQDYLKYKSIIQTEAYNFPTLDKGEEEFYVLENETQQLVFSTKGGAIAAINLPFASKKNTKSIVRPIEFDKSMLKYSPQNDYFPEISYSIFENGQEVKKQRGTLGDYSPLLRRSIYKADGTLQSEIPARYYAFNTLADDPEVENLIYKVIEFSSNHIVFQAAQPYRKITKTYTLSKEAPYSFNLSILIEGDSRNLWMNSGVLEVEMMSGGSNPILKYRDHRDDKSSIEKISLPSDAPTVVQSIQTDWLSNSNGFFGIIMDPLNEPSPGYQAVKVSGTLTPTRLTTIDAKSYPAADYPGYELLYPLRSTSKEMKFNIYAGPYADGILKEVDATVLEQTGRNPEYIGVQSFHGFFSFVSEPFAKFLFLLMNVFYSITHSWAFSIILLTIALRIMLYPINSWAIKSQERMKEIGPQIKKLQDKYKKDPKRMQAEVMQLQREKGVNPFGCIVPLLIQMPFLIGMFDLLKSTFALRGAVFIPGWIDNLTAPDVLFSWHYPVFFFGTQFHLLPIILGLAFYFQSKMSGAKPTKKGALTDQEKQQKMMAALMPIFFTLMFYSFPSGLNIYWISSTVLGILQQWFMTKIVKKKK